MAAATLSAERAFVRSRLSVGMAGEPLARHVFAAHAADTSGTDAVSTVRTPDTRAALWSRLAEL